ncbi:hypothetical protein ACFW04_006662 [Cataglyphis niger]
MAYFDADKDTEPVFDRIDTEYTIYVNSLPLELDEVAIKEVFNQYGKISGIFYPRNATWAYITYKSYREAEHAIRELNNKKPLYLKVALAKERSVIREEKLPKSYILESFEGRPKAIDSNLTEPPVSIHNDMKHQNGVGRGQTLNALRKHSAAQMTLDRYAENASLFPQTNNLYEIEEPIVNTNRLWTRGVITVTEDGRRHVSLGRGYILHEFPEENPKVEECIVHVFEKRQKGLYEYGENKFKNGVQRCHICSNKTSKHCEKCSTYYCSKVCQKKDWPRHQVECQQIPSLVEESINDMSLLQISKDENQMKIPPMSNKTIIPNEVKLRRPNAMQMENSNSTNANINMHKNNIEITNCSTDSDVIHYPDNNQDKHMSIRHDNTSISYTKTLNQQTLSALNTKDFSKQNPLQRCNNTKEDTEKSRKNDEYSLTTSNFTNQNHSHHNGAIKKTSSHNGKFDNNSSLRCKSYNNDRSQSYQKNELQNNRKSIAYNDREVVNRQKSNSSNDITIDDDLSFCKNMYLSKTEFTEVEISISLDNGEYWISTLKDSETRTKLMTELQSVAKKSRNVEPIIGDIYGVLYETLWHRVMIISLNPLKVHFIDYGNDEILQKDTEIRDISYMTKVPNLARKIRLTSPANEKYNFQCGEIIFIKMLSIDAEKTIIVDVKEQSRKLSSHLENASNTNNTVKKFVQQENLKVSDENVKPSVAQTPPTILDAFADLFSKKAIPELKFEGHIQICESVQENIYSATLGIEDFTTEIEMIFNDLQEECMKMQETVHYNSQDLICGEGKNAWCRGYILPSSTSSDLRIIAIDEARYMNVNKILPCPKKFLDIYAIGVICEVNHPNKLTVEEVYEFTTIMNEQNYEQDSLKIKIFKESEFVCEAMMRSWKFMIKSSFPAFSEIKSGSKICLTSYRNHYQMFVRSLDEEAIEYYNNIMQRVAECARTAPFLSNPPYNKQTIIAPFSDNNCYRALVINTQNDMAKIVYTDFGNVDNVDIKDLQVLPETLALQRSCSAKISLKNVPSEVSMNTEVDLFLRELVGNETSLTCIYEGDPLKDGVYLMMPTGESVNDKINQLLTPTWKQKDHYDNNCYMLDDIEFASLGQVGDTLDAVILDTPKENDGTRYMMCPNNIELYTYISEVMPKLLREYCEKTEYYIPREQELCLALYQNEWYRAACLNPKKSYTTAEVFYLDYGNIETVEHRNIRLMPKDFITPEAMSNICTVVNLAPVNNAGNYSPIIQEKILELIQKNYPIIKIKIVECDSGDYKIELPDIKNALIEEGLISSS